MSAGAIDGARVVMIRQQTCEGMAGSLRCQGEGRVEERRLEIDEGMELAALCHGERGGLPVLALHGWLDNGATWAPLASELVGVELVALDLAGHGRSDWRSGGRLRYGHFVDWVPEVVQAADALGWGEFVLLGHSMGGAIASLVAGTFRERVLGLVMVDAIGPRSDPPQTAGGALARAVRQRLAWIEEPEGGAVYDDEEEAVDRMLEVRMPMSREGARCLARRGLVEGPDGSGVRFGHDPALRLNSMLRLTEEQVQAFLRRIACPTLLIRPRQGWPVAAEELQERLDALEHLELVEVEGGHHVHLDHPERCLDALQRFFDGIAGGR